MASGSSGYLSRKSVANCLRSPNLAHALARCAHRLDALRPEHLSRFYASHAPAHPGRAGPGSHELLGRNLEIGVTMNIYSHVMPLELVQAADADGELGLWGLEVEQLWAVPARLLIPPSKTTKGRPSCLTNALVVKGGAEGTRTPDPHTASVVRYQLRHGPCACPGRPGTAREIVHTPPAWSSRGGPTGRGPISSASGPAGSGRPPPSCRPAGAAPSARGRPGGRRRRRRAARRRRTRSRSAISSSSWPGRPAGVAGEDPDPPSSSRSRSGSPDRSTVPTAPETRLKPAQPPTRWRVRARQMADSGCTGPPSKTHRRVAGEVAPAAEDVGDRHLGGAVEHDAERAAVLVGDQQHHGAFEVRVPQRRRRDQQLPGQRLHRPRPPIARSLRLHARTSAHPRRRDRRIRGAGRPSALSTP